MALELLPDELLAMIAEQLHHKSRSSVGAFAKTNRRLYPICVSILYLQNESDRQRVEAVLEKRLQDSENEDASQSDGNDENEDDDGAEHDTSDDESVSITSSNDAASNGASVHVHEDSGIDESSESGNFDMDLDIDFKPVIPDKDVDPKEGQNGEYDGVYGLTEFCALHWAARHGRPATLLRAKQYGVDICVYSVLGTAARYGQLSAIEVLMKVADKAWLSDEPASFLVLEACYNKREKAAKRLLELGVCPTDEPWRIALLAVRSGDLKLLRLLLQKTGGSSDERYSAPLMEAVLKGKIGMVRLLLENGTSADGGNRYHATACHAAVVTGARDILALLVHHGADLHIRDQHNRSILSYAIREEQFEMATLLIESGTNVNQPGTYGAPEALWTAVEVGSVDIVRMLIEKGADVNAVGCEGSSLLMHAACFNQTDVMEYLIDNGADVNTKTSTGITPLIRACERGRHSAICFLLEKGADVTATARTGGTCLHALALSGNIHAAKKIIATGDVDARKAADFDQWTALHLAAIRPNADMMNLLLTNTNCNVNATDVMGRTALFHASRLGNVECIRVLATHGARADIKDRYGSPPVFAAVRKRHVKAAHILLDMWPDAIHCTDYLESSLHDYALEAGPDGIVKLVNGYVGKPTLAGLPRNYTGIEKYDSTSFGFGCQVCTRVPVVHHYWSCDGCDRGRLSCVTGAKLIWSGWASQSAWMGGMIEGGSPYNY
jgi:ankyrin repeat protein